MCLITNLGLSLRLGRSFLTWVAGRFHAHSAERVLLGGGGTWSRNGGVNASTTGASDYGSGERTKEDWATAQAGWLRLTGFERARRHRVFALASVAFALLSGGG